MKIGIISDIHANLPALKAVLKALDDQGVVKIACGGDIVGYGPSPLECLDVIEERKIPCVRGNHDSMMTNTERDNRVRPEVHEAIEWTRHQLPQDARERLGTLPMTYQYAGIELVHASHVLNPPWNYVVDVRSATANFLFQRTAICFNGHTHLPLIALHRRSEHPKLIMFRDMELPRNHKFLINVGSVGQPRDRNPQASCAVFETRDRTIRLIRVPYDITETQRLMREADLPPRFAARLSQGR